MVKKGGKKKSGKKKGKGGESQMSFREVIVAYRITMKEQEVDDLKFEVRKMETRNQNLAARNEHLLDEQASLTAQCLEKAREWRNNTDKPEALGSDSVISILLEMWKQRDNEEAELSAIHEAIISAEVETNRLQVDVNEWKDFQNYGKAAQAEQIMILEQEKMDNAKMFDEKSVFLSRDLDTTRSDVFRKAEESVENEKMKAAEKAMGVLQLGGRVELEDSRFLRSELKIHREEHTKLQQDINELENKNLAILSCLFDCKVEDIRFSKSIFSSLFKQDELLDEEDNYILQTDIDEFQYFDDEDENAEDFGDEMTEENSVLSAESDLEEEEQPIVEPKRPMSATMQSVQKKLRDQVPKVSIAVSTDLPEAIGESDFRGIEMIDVSDKFIMETIPEYDPYMDYVTVGNIESKLLAITGKKMPLVKRSKSELEALGINIDDLNNQGFFHWPENLNSSKLSPLVPPSEKPVPFTGKMLVQESALSKQALLTPVDSIPSSNKHQRQSIAILTSPMPGTPSARSVSSKKSQSGNPPASPSINQEAS